MVFKQASKVVCNYARTCWKLHQLPRGPNDQTNSISLKIFNLDRNFKSLSSKISIFGRAPKYRTKGCAHYWPPKFAARKWLKWYRNKHTQICTPSLETTALWPYSNPEGPTIKKIKSRSKFSTSIEMFDPARKFQSRRLDFPQKMAAAGGSLENVILARNFRSRSKSEIFWSLGPLGCADIYRVCNEMITDLPPEK